jgi:hypothetical protein
MLCLTSERVPLASPILGPRQQPLVLETHCLDDPARVENEFVGSSEPQARVWPGNGQDIVLHERGDLFDRHSRVRNPCLRPWSIDDNVIERPGRRDFEVTHFLQRLGFGFLVANRKKCSVDRHRAANDLRLDVRAR